MKDDRTLDEMIQKELFAMQDIKYKAFHEKLIPGV